MRLSARARRRACRVRGLLAISPSRPRLPVALDDDPIAAHASRPSVARGPFGDAARRLRDGAARRELSQGRVGGAGASRGNDDRAQGRRADEGASGPVGIPPVCQRKRRVHAARADGRTTPSARSTSSTSSSRTTIRGQLLMSAMLRAARARRARAGAGRRHRGARPGRPRRRARRAPQHRGAALQPVLLPRLDRAAALRGVRADDQPPELPDAQQAVRRRQRDRASSAAATSATSTSTPATSSQFGDYDVFALGPIARELSKSFDEYWNSSLAIPVRALVGMAPRRPSSRAWRRSSPRTARRCATASRSGRSAAAIRSPRCSPPTRR